MKRGDIVQLGRHRLMCGDCTHTDDVNTLFGDHRTDLIFSSPPYLNQRRYGDCSANNRLWDDLIHTAFSIMPHTADCQMFINLGLIAINGEHTEFWRPAFDKLKSHGWRRFSWYVWNKQESTPGDYNGRLSAAHEFVFHLNKARRYPNKIMPCKRVGEIGSRRSVKRTPDNFDFRQGPRRTHAFKIATSVISCYPDKSPYRKCHPALGSTYLPATIIESFKDSGTWAYDPFAGIGTTLIAAQACDIPCLAMEINPTYCETAIERYHKHIEKTSAPSKPKRKVIT